MHLVMCLALNKRPFTKERKKEEESKKNTTIRGCFEKNIMKSVNLCKFKIVFLICFKMDYRDFSVKSKVIISLFQTERLSLSIFTVCKFVLSPIIY